MNNFEAEQVPLRNNLLRPEGQKNGDRPDKSSFVLVTQTGGVGSAKRGNAGDC